MSDQKAGVHGQAPVQAGQVLLERRPIPGTAAQESFDGNPLDHRHHPLDVESVVRTERGDGEPAVAPEDGGDTVKNRRTGRGVPQQLGVVMRVEIDKSGADDLAGDIDGSPRRLVGRTQSGDPPVTDTDVGRRALPLRCRR